MVHGASSSGPSKGLGTFMIAALEASGQPVPTDGDPHGRPGPTDGDPTGNRCPRTAVAVTHVAANREGVET